MFFLLGIEVSLAQQPVAFKHLTVENGLSSGSVLSITQDKKGFIWIGTMDGLNRYDGRTIKIFKEFYRNNIIEQNIQINRLMADTRQNIWIGTNNGLYLYNTKRDSFKVFFHTGLNDGKSISNNNIKAIYQDSRENVWIGTEQGLNKLVPDKNGQYQFVPLNDALQDKDVEALLTDSDGNLLIGTTTGFFVIPAATNKPHQYKALSVALKNTGVSSIAEDNDKQIWIGTSQAGLYRYSKSTGRIQHYQNNRLNNSGLTSNQIKKTAIDKKGRLWVATLKGLNLYDAASDTFKSFLHNSDDPLSISNNVIFDIFIDDQGSVWAATFFGGVNIVEALSTKFKVYRNDERPISISSNIVSAIAEDENHNLWIGTEDEGLNFFDRKRNIFSRFKSVENNPLSLGSNNVKAVLKDTKNRIWVGLYNGGLELVENGKPFKHFRQNSSINPVRSNDVTCLMEDSFGRIWIGHQASGIDVFDNGKIKKFETVYPNQKLFNNYVTCIFQDTKKNIWIGTKQGLNVINFKEQKLSYLLRKNHPGLNSDIINCITEDKSGVIWVGTYAGISRYDTLKKSFHTYTVADGLAANQVVGIVVDNENNLWISSNSGLSKLNASRTRFSIYNVYDGLPANVFNNGSFFKDSKGVLLFGSYNGLVEFSPKDIETNVRPPKVKLTGLSVRGVPVIAHDSTGILKNELSATNEIVLNHNQNIVTVTYAVLNFIKPEKSRSAFKLEGYNNSWVYTNDHVATFTNLPTGNYTLLVKSCNNDGVWNKSKRLLKISILPPIWLTWWAYTIYVILALSVLFAILYSLNYRATLLRNLRYEQLANAKQRELHKMKMDFFTHISHEFRTPLTMIMGPVEMLKDLTPSKSTNQKLLNSIKNNADRLLKLTNDLMDFRKADAGHTQLKLVKSDIVKFSRDIYERFTENAFGKSLTYNFSSTEDSIDLYFDPDHLEIVLTNLLSNAFKFTPDGGKVSIHVIKTGGLIEIKVYDNGIGIPIESQAKIFSSFYQVDAVGNKNSGSGIGLAFSKNLVELHGGELHFYSVFDSLNGNETCFIIALKQNIKH